MDTMTHVAEKQLMQCFIVSKYLSVIILLGLAPNVDGQGCGTTCFNGGTCYQGQGAGTSYCVCRTGYVGTYCEQDVSVPTPCSSNPCQNNAQGCVLSEEGDSYFCLCREGTYGTNCQYLSGQCSSNPCQNGGTCVPGQACSCRPGYYGSNCQYVVSSPCSSNPCQNNGRCILGEMENTYKCICYGDSYGTNCQFNSNSGLPSTTGLPCLSNPCVNGGTCRNYNTFFLCLCRPGYIGTLCELSGSTTTPLTSTTTTTQPTTNTPLDRNTCSGIGDIVFVMDSSAHTETEHNWQLSIDFVADLVDGLSVHSNDFRIGLVKYSQNVTSELSLNSVGWIDKYEIISRIKGVPYDNSLSDLAQALLVTQRDEFSVEKGDRAMVPNMVFLILHGPADMNTHLTLPYATAIKERGIKMYVIGITNKVNYTEVYRMSSHPKELNRNYFLAPYVTTLPSMRNAIIEEICQEVDGNLGQAADPCVPNPCSNGGICTWKYDGYTPVPVCTCTNEKYHGSKCELVKVLDDIGEKNDLGSPNNKSPVTESESTISGGLLAAGVVVGVVVGSLLLAFTLYCVYCYPKRKEARSNKP